MKKGDFNRNLAIRQGFRMVNPMTGRKFRDLCNAEVKRNMHHHIRNEFVESSKRMYNECCEGGVGFVALLAYLGMMCGK